MTAKLRKRLSLDPYLLPIFGNDPEQEDDDHEEEEETPKPTARTRERKPSRRKRTEEEDDDDEDPDDLDGIEDPQQRKIAELSRENAKHRRLKNAERKEKEQLAARLAEMEKAGKTKEEQEQIEIKTLRSENSKLTKYLEKNTLRSAILGNEKYKWYNIDDAIRDLDLDDLDIDLESGEVDGLDSQLKALAKKKPYLLKDGQDASGDQQGGTTSGSRTGYNPRGGQRKKSRDATNTEELLKRYPSLRENAPIT